MSYDAWGDIQDIPLPPKYSSMVCGGSKESGGACGICEMCLDGARLPTPQVATLRDQFAMSAVTGILANSENVAAGAEPTNSAISGLGYPDWLALTAYRVADAMMKQRDVGK